MRIPGHRDALLAGAVLVLLLGSLTILSGSSTNAEYRPTLRDLQNELLFPETLDNRSSLKLSKGGSCFGPCKTYTLLVCGDGTVFYQGWASWSERNPRKEYPSEVNTTGVVTYSLSDRQVRYLFEEVYRSDFYFLTEKTSTTQDKLISLSL